MTPATRSEPARAHSGARRGERPGPRLADAVVLTVFLATPLAVSPALWDQFTTAKWYTLEALAATWFVVEVWRYGSCGWPAFVRQWWLPFLVLAGLVVLTASRVGVAWAVPTIVYRAGFVLLVLAAYWYFRRNEGEMWSITTGVGIAMGVTVTVGLAQIIGWQPLAFLLNGDRRSAFFGNVNMTAQFLGLAVILLLAGGPSALHARLRETLVTASFVYLYFLSCRSVFVALAGALVFLVAARRISAASLVRMIGVATLGVLLLLHLGPLLGEGPDLRGLFSAEVQPEKAESTAWRLVVWRSTLNMIRDHPFGVGSGNFGDAFIPYQLGLERVPGEAVLFRTPHNEYLRTLAEEGIIVTVVLTLLLVSLLRRLYLRVGAGQRWRTEQGALLGAGLAFLLVEAFFQFPFGTAFGCLATSVLLGLALAEIDSSYPKVGSTTQGHVCPAPPLWRAVGALVAGIVVVLLGRVAISEVLFVNRRGDATAQAAACRLNPRNLPACVTAAWLRAREGDRRQARRLLVQVVQHSPYYHPAIRLLGEEAAAHGDRQEACHYLWLYDRLFRERSAVHGRLDALCGDVPPLTVPADLPIPYYGSLPLTRSDAALR